ncbi:MAG: 50S ribosomal protein L3 [Thermoplasmata archaeon]|nr:50S ribosomal protein L3 [Thermoplasmata archaeon]
MAYSPRKRARSEVARLKSWPEGGREPKVQGFAGYKAGMTHIFLEDKRAKSLTQGQEIRVPVTILEVPPMRIIGVRAYVDSPYGLKTLSEVWSKKFDPSLERRLTLPEKPKEHWKRIEAESIDDLRLIAQTQPHLVTSIPKKIPEIMELRIGGGTMEERVALAKDLLGKEVKAGDVISQGSVVDVAAVTRGKGWQGVVRRWGVKLLVHKNDKHRRMVGTLGPWRTWIMTAVPQGGQTGYHQRTEYNKVVLRVGDNGLDVTPKGGFIKYGEVRNGYVMIGGSVPGPAKRLVRVRDAVRFNGKEQEVNITYVSVESNMGR